MRPGIERRSTEARRIPLDLWIRLNHEDFEEPFDADSVDVSAGGIAMRADYLPEVGDRLRCRFDCPPEGGEIEVDGEVVWAHDQGDRSGEFGVRFATLDVAAESSLRQLVEHLGGAPTGGPARLHLDGVATPVDAQIVERDGEWLVAEQELPFLRIGMGVVVEGTNGPPRGRLSSVDLRLEDGTPRLVLGVEFDRAGASDAETVDAETADAETVDTETVDEEPQARASADPTGLAAETLDEEPQAVAASASPATDDETVQDFALPAELRGDAPSFGGEAGDGLEDDEDAAPAREAVQIFRVQGGADADAMTPERLAADAVEEARPEAGLAGLQQRLQPALAKAREVTAGLARKAKPMGSAAWTKVVAFAALVTAKAGPGARALAARLGRVAVALWAQTGAKLSKKAKRRTTAAPPKRVAQSPRLRRQRAEAEAQAQDERPNKKNRRIVLLSVLAFAGVGSAVYALTGSEAQSPEPPINAPTIPAPPPDMEVDEPADAPDAPGSEGDDASENDTPPDETSDTDPPPAGAAEGGRLGEPTYPSLRDATERRDAPVTEGQTFGDAEVPNGRAATIRMSNPVTTLRGQRQEGGFTVTVPGALALDRAGPLAAANPDVERAMVLNRGDHSVLTVTFVAGRSPAYRVAAQGSAIEVTIGR